MNEQTTFVEPLARKRRVVTGPAKIAEKMKPLAEWYSLNKPNLKSMRISSNDAYSLRTMWKDPKKQPEVRMAGFDIRGQDIHWRGFDLTEVSA